jgi:hypothetical protein
VLARHVPAGLRGRAGADAGPRRSAAEPRLIYIRLDSATDDPVDDPGHSCPCFRSLPHSWSGGFGQESKIGEADAVGALDGFCPTPDNTAAGAWIPPAPNARITVVPRRRSDNLRFSRQPTGVWRRRSGSASGSEGERAVSAARAARRAALKPYRKTEQIEARHEARHEVPRAVPGAG